MEDCFANVAESIRHAHKCIALTGAGISAESGIPTFRSKGGLWEKYDPAVYASIEVFRQDPAKYWTIRGDFIRNYDQYQPNPGHLALAELEKLGFLHLVITQNIDGLHVKAGNKNVVELHGNLRQTFCLSCGKEYIAPHVPPGTPPYCSECGGVLKPNTVLFGESLPPEALLKAQQESAACDVMLLIGTSAVVFPAAALPQITKRGGGKVVEINLENACPFADYFIGQKAGTALPAILSLLKKA